MNNRRAILIGVALFGALAFVALYPACLVGRLSVLHIVALIGALVGASAFARLRSIPLWFRLLAFTILFLPSALEFLYAVRFGMGWDQSALHAVLQSNVTEGMSFVCEFYSFRHVLLFVACLAVPPAFLWWAGKTKVWNRAAKPVFACLLPAFLLLPSTQGVLAGYLAYRAELANWKRELEKRRLGPLEAETPWRDEAYLVVIGESASRRHWSLYGYDRNTTPEMEAIPDLRVFRDVVSTHSHTSPALTKALTASLVSDSDTYASPGILDLANAAGFTTYWLSNQQRMGPWDNPVSILAEAAKHKSFLNYGFGKSLRSSGYDEALLPAVAEALAGPGSRKLIVLHLMGSHFPYSARYPPGYAKFSGAGKAIDAYDNSIAYVDHLLGRLFRMAERAGVDGVVYFSDHGEDVPSGLAHNSSRMTKAMVEIPLVVLTSKRYRERYPETAEQIRRGTDKPLSGDYIFHLLVHLMQFRTPVYPNPLAMDFVLPPRRVRNGELSYEELE